MPSQKKQELLGILGGLGPMASVYFYELLTAHTKAERDSDHIDMLLSSRASTPDRTAFILGQSEDDPGPVMCCEARRLEQAGATLIAIPCNTAHYFYRQISEAVNIPVINIVTETVRMLAATGVKKVGVLATEGTVRSGAYRTACRSAGIGYEVPDTDDQLLLNRLIYGQIKRGEPPDTNAFLGVSERLAARGCDRLVLGCTELSLIGRGTCLDPRLFADSLEILAYTTILACHKSPVGFPGWFSGEAETVPCGKPIERSTP